MTRAETFFARILAIASAFRRDRRGAAAVEFALWFTFLIAAVFNAADIGVYVYRRMQVDMAAQAAVQAAWHLCDGSSKLPLTTCATATGSNVLTTMQTAAQSTSLGTAVSLAAANVKDAYYCSNGSGALTQTGTAGSTTAAPSYSGNCSAVLTGNTQTPGEYVQVTVTYTFTPMFQGVTVASLLPSAVSRQAWLRLD